MSRFALSSRTPEADGWLVLPITALEAAISRPDPIELMIWAAFTPAEPKPPNP